MTTSSRLTRLLVLTLSLTVTGAAVAQYAWIDEKGNKQFSDQPPPPSVPKNKILKFSGQPLDSQDNSMDSGTDTGRNAKPVESMADKELAYKKRRAEQDRKNQQVEEQAKATALKNDNCLRMREYKQTLDSGQRIQQTDTSGNRSYLSDDKRSEELTRLNQNLSECSN